jgi:hypothetical protein
MMRKRRGITLPSTILLIVTAILLTACQAPIGSFPPVFSGAEGFPPPGQVITAAVGEPMAELQPLEAVDGIRFISTYENKIESPPSREIKDAVIRINPGDAFVLVRTVEDMRWYVGTAEDLRKGGQRKPVMLTVFPESTVFVQFSGERSSYIAHIAPELYEETKISIPPDPEHRSVLVYAGRRGNEIELLYQEYSMDLGELRATENLTFDLTAGAVIEISGARFEIIEADIDKIRFKRLSDGVVTPPELSGESI